MAGTNLVRTTLTGVRPLGVRGEPLHQAHEQIRGVVRRRLGERHARLLAEPQPDEIGRRIDWYTDLPGAVVPLSELAPERRASLLAEVEKLSGDIASLAASLRAAPSDDAQLTGRALELTARRPSDDYIFLVDDQPVIVCWGYDTEAAGALLPLSTAPTLTSAAVPPVVAAPAAPAAVLASGPATLAAAGPFSWWRWLLIGLFAILLALILSYFLRQCSPVGPDVAITQLPPPPAPPAPPPPPDPAIGLRGDLGAAQSDETKLRATLASLRDELVAKRAACKPPEPPKPPPKPPQAVEKKPDPPKPPPKPKPPQVVERKPDPPRPPPGDDRMRMPKAPTNDYSFLQGCWRTDTFKHGPRIRPGYATYCFDGRGNGSMEFRFDNGVTCRAPATARFNGGQLAVTDADTTCSPRGRWAQDHLYCTPGTDGVANCSGSNRTERWTVNLHRVR